MMERDITSGTGQRLSTYTSDAVGTTSNGLLLTDGTFTSEATRSDAYSFSGTAHSTTSYEGTASSTWNRPLSFTQTEDYSYSASYEESRTGSGSSLQTMLAIRESEGTFSHAGFTFTQEGRIDSRELQSRSYSESSSATGTSSGEGTTSLYQFGMPRSGEPSMSSFAYSANGTNSLLSYDSLATMEFTGSGSSRETLTQADDATLNRLSPFLETVTSDAYSQETYSSASTFSLADGVVERSSSGSYTETFTHHTLGTYAGESYSLSSVTFDSLQTGSHSYSESQAYDITSGTHLGTFTSYAQSLSTLSAAAPATLLGISFAYSTASGTSSYTFEGTYRSEALGTTSYSESNLRRGTYALGSYSYSNLENHADGVRHTTFEATNIQEITAGLGTYQHDSTVSVSSNVSSSNNGWEHTSSSDNLQSSNGTTTVNFTRYSEHQVEANSQITFSRDEYGSASHMTLSLTSINYQETGTGLVTTSIEVFDHSTSLMTSMEEFFYNDSESLELTGAATGFDFNSSRHSGLVGYFDNSTATLARHNESRSTFTAQQVTDYHYSNGLLGEYTEGQYSFSSMAYQSTASHSSLTTATSLDTLVNKDVYRLLDAMPDSNGMSLNSDPGDGAVGSSTSSSSGHSVLSYLNSLLQVTDTTSTSASSALETYSSLGQYANFSTSLTSFSHRSSGKSLATMNFTQMLTGTMSESSLGYHTSENGSGSTTGSGIRNASGNSTSGGLTDGGALYTFNTETTGYAYSELDYSTRQEGYIPADLGTELTYYESRVTLSAEQYAEEVEETEFTRTQTQTDGTADDTGSSSLNVPQPFSGPYEYEADDRTNDSSQTVTHGFEAIRTGLRETFAEQFRTSYEYGTYSEGDYNLSCATYFSAETATVSFSHITSLENEVSVEKAGYNHRVNNWAHSGSSDKYTADDETHTHDTFYRSLQTIESAGNSTLTNTQFEQGVYSNGSYSYGSIAYDSNYNSNTTTTSSESSSVFTASEYSRRTVTDMSATQNHWNNLNKPTGFVLIEWFAEFTQSLSGTITNNSTSTSNESYESVIRGTSTGQDFSFSLISSTYDATTTESTSNGTSSTASFTGYHTTGLVGVYRNIEGEITSSESTGQTSTVHVNKQHLGSMYDGVACVVYDKMTIDTNVTISSSSSYAISYEGDHADFEVNSYDSSDVTITNGYSTHEYSEVAFDPEATDPWSLVSYASINTMTSGYSYDEESNFALSQRWTTTGGGSNGSHTYNHERERTDTGSFDATFVEEKYGYSIPDGEGGYIFVFDDYTITNSYTEDGEYTNVGFAESFGVITAMFFGASTYEHRYDWDKERERDGSGTESISGATSGDTFVYGSYSKNFSRDDTGDYFGVHQSAGTGSLYFWSHATLIYDETLEYRHTADLDEYEVSIDFAAPWTLTYTTDSTPLTTMTGATLESYTDSGEDAKKPPAPPMPLAMNFEETKVGEYYGLAAGVIASYGSTPVAFNSGAGSRINPAPDGGGTVSGVGIGRNPSSDKDIVFISYGSKVARNTKDVHIAPVSGYYESVAPPRPSWFGEMFRAAGSGLREGLENIGKAGYGFGKGFFDLIFDPVGAIEGLIDTLDEGITMLRRDPKGTLSNAWENIKKDPSRVLAEIGVNLIGSLIPGLGKGKGKGKTGAAEPVAPVEPVKPVAPAAPVVALKPSSRAATIGCFPAGVLLQTPLGHQRIETFKTGDQVLTRDEHDVEAPWQIGTVSETVRRLSSIWRLQVNGREILTTNEHPFWVMGQGWVNADQIKLNDKLRTLNGVAVVEASGSTEQIVEVFNITIEPSHTYFVGGDDWGFVVWSHNVAACWEPGLNTKNKTAREATRGKDYGVHNNEKHHPLKRAKTWKEFWEARGWSWDEVKKWWVLVNKDAHQAMEKAGLWEKRLKEKIAEAEAVQGNRPLNKAQSKKIAQELLDVFWAWLKPI